MDIKCIRNFLSACHEAKKIPELMPKLPNGMKPRHIHVIETIYSLSQEKRNVKVSDISEAMNVTKPSITRLINELEEKGVLVKHPQSYDNRIITLTLTSLGEEYYDSYVDKFHKELSELLAGISEEEIRISTQIMRKVYKLMKTKE